MKIAIGGLLITSLVAFQVSDREPGEPQGEGTSSAPSTYEQARQRAQSTPGYENLKRLGLAFHGYHDLFGHFPPAVLVGPDGETKYSWRVELLPVLKHYVDGRESERLQAGTDREQFNALIEACGYDLSRPWDDATNAGVLKRMPDVYRHPHDADDSTESAYYVITGQGTAFEAGRLSSYVDIKAWVATTLMIAESRSREPWTKPVDIGYSPATTVPRLGGFTKGGSLVLTCDGAVHYVHESVSADSLRSLMTRDTDDDFSIIGIPYQY